MLSKKIIVYTLAMINFVIINTSDVKRTQTQGKINLSEVGEKLQQKFKQNEQSCSVAQPQTYLKIQYKNQYIEIVQQFTKTPNITTSSEETKS